MRPNNAGTTAMNIRIQQDLLDAIDAWAVEASARSFAPVTRSALVKALLAWAVKERPDIREPAKKL